jgi:DNA invertase Pin-like site-specific DNA recombinase
MDKIKYIGYIRKSKKDLSSTLGLEAQQTEIARYVGGHDGQLINTFVEIESGTSSKLVKRTIIWEALDACKQEGATLIVAKLDRLARDVEFTSRLMNLGVKFVACDIPQANEFTIHVMAAVAEQEAKRISERTKEALARKKANGANLGWRAHKTRKGCPFDKEAREKAAETNKNKSLNNPRNKRAVAYAHNLYKQGETYNHIAYLMNREGFKSPHGNRISATTVMRWVGNYDKFSNPAPDMA